MTNSEKIYLLPGLGADHRLFNYQSQALPEVVVPEWLPPNEGECLSQYAQRWAQSLPLKDGDALGGMSFGGQVALELAKHLNPKCVFLIASHRRSSEISSVFKMQSRLLPTLPDSLVRSGLVNLALPKLEREEDLRAEPMQWLHEMADDMDYSFFRWATWAAATWQFDFQAKDFSMPIYQIRGEHDSIIPNLSPQEVEIVPGAGHLINYTHPEQLNAWLLEKLKLAQTPESTELSSSG